MNEKDLQDRSLEGDRTGQLFIYEDNDNVTKACMVGYEVPQHEYDLMPEYLQEHFERVTDEHNEVLCRPENVNKTIFVIPEETVKTIKEYKLDFAETNS